MNQAVKTRALFARIGCRIAHDDEGSRQHLQMVGMAAEPFHAPFHIGIECARIGETAAGTKDDLGSLRRELAACLRRAGLHDDRPALNRTGDIERPSYFEKFTPM